MSWATRELATWTDVNFQIFNFLANLDIEVLKGIILNNIDQVTNQYLFKWSLCLHKLKH